jgi:two-component system response regulator HydG
VKPLVLIVDDERSNLESLARIFEREDWRVALAEAGAPALEIVRRDRPAVVVTDLMMPGMSGEELLRAVKAVAPEIEVVVMTAHGTVETAVAAMKEGAYDFITKPFKKAAVVKSVRQALEKASLVAENRALRARIAALSSGAGGMLGDAPSFRAALETLRQVAPTSATVLLTGESGTGKELAARLVHDLSPRAAGPFVPIHCAAIPETLLESELFGHEKGAFTGAVARKEGRLERAKGGTLFLDEVGEMPPAAQVKLLRFLQDGVLERVGGHDPIRVDARVVAATHRDLAQLAKEGAFREDLLYRLDVVSVRLPPLRERREDVMLLAGAFLERTAASLPKRVTGFSPGAAAALERYAWPGNVRELHHAVERAVILCRGDVIDAGDLPESIRSQQGTGPGGALGTPAPLVLPFGTPMDEVERIVIKRTLEQTRGDKSLAAQILGIAARTIYRKLDRDAEGRLLEPGAALENDPEPDR